MTKRRRAVEGAGRRSGRHRHGLGMRIASQVTLLAFLAGPIHAEGTSTSLGSAETVAGGGAFTINEQDHTEYTQSQQSTILEWDRDIQQPASHLLEFRQDERFVILNRTPGVNISNMNGTVVCDATCIFANEAGIVFGDGSFVDVGQLIAVGGNISNADFQRGDYHFTGVEGTIENHGIMQGDAISLIGQRVANFGYVDTGAGGFMMLAGDEVWLRDHDSPILIRSELSPHPDPDAGFGGEPAIENAGEIVSRGGKVRLAAGDMLSFAIRQRQGAAIRADEIVLEGGEGGLVEVRGSLDAHVDTPGERGGQIDVLGDYVSIQDGAILDASGEAGGGEIRVGGDEGGAAGTRASKGTFVHTDAQLIADATAEGDGGRVIVWSDGYTQSYGRLSARGGLQGGNGGFVETSGKLWLDVDGVPDLSARGERTGDRGGEWLIDPNNIEIVESQPPCSTPLGCVEDLDSAFDPDRRNNPFFIDYGGPTIAPSVNDSRITAGLIADALGDGFNVRITTQTIGNTPGDQDGNITVSGAILIDDRSVDEGTLARLEMHAANDIVVNANIAVTDAPSDTQPGSTTPSNMTLDLILEAGDTNQPQNTSADSAVPNIYVGELQINADIKTEGGGVDLDGIGFVLAQNASIVTNGGGVGIESLAGDAIVLGNIDTSTNVVGDGARERDGGSIGISATANRRPVDSTVDAETVVVGGDVIVGGRLDSGGATIDLRAIAGDLALDPGARIASDGGIVLLRSLAAEFPPLSSSDTDAILSGGTISFARDSLIESNGGFVEIGGTPDERIGLGAIDIVMRGGIDSQVYLENGSVDDSTRGGAVVFNTASVIHKGVEQVGGVIVRREGSDPNDDPRITTNGGSFTSLGPGTFSMRDAVIDVSRAGAGVTPDLEFFDISIQHGRGVAIEASQAGATELLADNAISLAGGLTGGVDDLTLRGGIEAHADRYVLTAGDGYTPNSGQQSQVLFEPGDDASQIQFRGVAGVGGPSEFSISQDASFDVQSVIPYIASPDALEGFAAAANDGTLTAGAPSPPFAGFSNPDLAILLRSARDFTVDPGFIASPIEQLTLETFEDFVVDSTLAMNLRGEADAIVLRAGLEAGVDTDGTPLGGIGDLTIEGDLRANQALTLHAGAGGAGDLHFDAGVTLASQNITLRAGNGDSAGDSRIDAGELRQIWLDLSPGGPSANSTATFTLRQDAAIDDDLVPDSNRFVDGVASLDYRLRSDVEGIRLAQRSAAALDDTRLRLHARQDIVLDAALTVETMDIGGLESFFYTHALNDRIEFSPYDNDGTCPIGTCVLVLRAGLDNPGTLSFESGLAIEADEIRLVASDGVGRNGAGGTSGSAINLDLGFDGYEEPIFRALTSPDALTFVYRQDADLLENQLPSLTRNFDGNRPDRYALRSDDGTLELTAFGTEFQPIASSLLVLSAGGVSLLREDGVDLDLDQDFGLSDGTGVPSVVSKLEIRAGQAVLVASDSAGLARPEFLPGSNTLFTGFDAASDDARSASELPVPVDLSAAPATSPEAILITQTASIDADNLIGLGQLGASGAGDGRRILNLYQLISEAGSITLTPDDVRGADLTAILFGENPDADRSIDFVPNGSNPLAFDLASLFLVSDFELRLGGGTSHDGALTIRTGPQQIDADPNTTTGPGLIEIRSGQGGEGDLIFADTEAVELEGTVIQLYAGTLGAGEDDDPNLPVVRVSDSTRLVFAEDPNQIIRTLFGLYQQGSLSDDVSQSRQPGISLLPDASNFFEQAYDANGAPDGPQNPDATLDVFELAAERGDILIDDLFLASGATSLPARNLAIGASGRIRLGQSDGQDLDLRGFESLFLAAVDIELRAVSADPSDPDGFVMAEGDGIFFSGVNQNERSSPTRFSVVQDAPFAEDQCATGCLPNAFQFAGTPTGMDYTIESRDGSILFDDVMAGKVWGADLLLLANAATGPDVHFDATSPRLFDAFFTSLQVGIEGVDEDQLDIRLTGRKDPDDPALTMFSFADIEFFGQVSVEGDVRLTASSIEFSNSLDAAATPSPGPGTGVGAYLTVRVLEQARFDLDVGATNALDLFRVEFITNQGAAPTAEFGAGHTNPLVVRAGAVEFVAVTTDLETLTISEVTSRAPTAATIFRREGDLGFEADDFAVGTGEKISVGGALTIQATNRAAIGDIAALEIDVIADTIEVRRRAAGSYLSQTGELLNDAGLSFVANDIDFDGDIVLTGSGNDPIFGVENTRNTPDWMNRYSVFAIHPDRSGLTLADFEWDVLASTIPTLHPQGASRDDISPIFFGPELAPAPGARGYEGWIPWNDDTLLELDIYARPGTRAEYASRVAGAGIFDDVGRDLGAWDGEPLQVSANRLTGQEAQTAVALYDNLFGRDGSRARGLKRILQQALDHYRRATGTRKVVGFELRRYVKNRPSSRFEAYRALEDLDRLFAYHRRLGLTPGEYRPIQRRWLESIKPDGISVEELAEAIRPSRYVRGTDVLDIFGE